MYIIFLCFLLSAALYHICVIYVERLHFHTTFQCQVYQSSPKLSFACYKMFCFYYGYSTRICLNIVTAFLNNTNFSGCMWYLINFWLLKRRSVASNVGKKLELSSVNAVIFILIRLFDCFLTDFENILFFLLFIKGSYFFNFQL